MIESKSLKKQKSNDVYHINNLITIPITTNFGLQLASLIEISSELAIRF